MNQRVRGDDWKDLDDETRHGFWYTYKWAIAAVIAVLSIIALVWVLGVLSSDVKGRGEAVKENKSARNRIAQQEGFQQLYQDIQAADERLDVLWDAYQADKTDPILRQNWTGGVNVCTNLVHDYDAKAKKYTAKQWRDEDLPKTIDQTDPKFDCKITKKETPK